jgi:hypothetical protein
MQKTGVNFIFLATFAFFERFVFYGVKYSLLLFFTKDLNLDEEQAFSFLSNVSYYMPLLVTALAITLYYYSNWAVGLALSATCHMLCAISLLTQLPLAASIFLSAGAAFASASLFALAALSVKSSQSNWSLGAKILVIMLFINLGALLSTLGFGYLYEQAGYIWVYSTSGMISIVLLSFCLFFIRSVNKAYLLAICGYMTMLIGCIYIVDFQKLLSDYSILWLLIALILPLCILNRDNWSIRIFSLLIILTLATLAGLDVINNQLTKPILFFAQSKGLSNQIILQFSTLVTFLIGPLFIVAIIFYSRNSDNRIAMVFAILMGLFLLTGLGSYFNLPLWLLMVSSFGLLLCAESFYVFPIASLLEASKTKQLPLLFAIYYLLYDVAQHFNQQLIYYPNFYLDFIRGNLDRQIDFLGIEFLLPFFGMLVIGATFILLLRYGNKASA